MNTPQGTSTPATDSHHGQLTGVLRPKTGTANGEAAPDALTAAVDDMLETRGLAEPMTRLFDGLVAAGWTGEHAAIAAGVAVVTARVTASLIIPVDR